MPTTHIDQHVTSTEFANAVDRYLDDAAKEPIVITQHNRPVCVLIDIDEYKRLKAYDTRQSLHPSGLASDLREQLEISKMDSRHDHLNSLLD
ncbi:MAG: type II toxin-antitoxin system Phd/YefM family antitoxin [Parvibaculaceae bacterium]|nr:type II toxin-antitoxin system Phd/YefM family antitoxin [Parvibaculaceae bacterium]